MSEVMELPCACMEARRVARLITRMYADEMRGAMEPTQFGLLSLIEKHANCTQSDLVLGLGLDKTTVSRDVAVIRRKGWITGGRGGLMLTDAGSRVLAEARPHWRRAQKRLQQEAGDDWEAMWNSFRNLSARLSETNRDQSS